MLRNTDKGLAFITGYKGGKAQKSCNVFTSEYLFLFPVFPECFLHSEYSNRNIEMWTRIEARKDCLLCDI